MKHHLFLVGYRGCGKSLIGRLVADLLQRTVIDSDDAVERAAGKSIREIFSDEGELVFRDLESRAIDQIVQSDQPLVVSLGGGAILRAENRTRLEETGRTVWLQATPETIAARLAADTNTVARRPALTKLSTIEEIAHVLSIREPLYREVAQFAIATDDCRPEAIAHDIWRWYTTASSNLGKELN